MSSLISYFSINGMCTRVRVLQLRAKVRIQNKREMRCFVWNRVVSFLFYYGMALFLP